MKHSLGHLVCIAVTLAYRFVGFALLLPALAAAQAAETEMLINGEMEGPFISGLAGRWVPNCYGSNEVAFAQERADVHGGKSAQRVTCTRFVDGGVQFHSGDIAVQQGRPYTLCLSLKGEVTAPVYVGIRKHGAPYTPYLKREIRVRKNWTPCLIMGQTSDSDERCGIYIMFAGTGTLLVDDVFLKPGLHEDANLEVDGPVQKGNRIYNSGFEAGPEGWTPVNGFVLDDQVVHSGRFSARLEASRSPGTAAGMECRPFPVRTGRRYTLSAWVKAAEPDTKVRFRLFEWADRGGDGSALGPAARFRRFLPLVARLEPGQAATFEYVGDGRKQEALDGYWGPMPAEHRAVVEAVAMDLWEPYFNSTTARVPEAAQKIVHDPYHLGRMLSEAVDKVRQAEHRVLAESGDDRLAGRKYVCLYGWENLPEGQQERFDQLRGQRLKTSRAWALKEMFRDFWTSETVTEGREFFRRWYSWAIRSRLEPIKQVARSFKGHLENVLTYFTHRITNAALEGLNNRIAGLVKKAFGYRNRERFKTDILFHLGGLDLYPGQ